MWRRPSASRRLAPAAHPADQHGGSDATLHHGVDRALDGPRPAEVVGQNLGGRLVEDLQVELGVGGDVLPVQAGQGLGLLAKVLAEAAGVDLVLHGPGQGPVVGVALVDGEELEGKQGQRVAGVGQHGVQVAADGGGADTVCAGAQETVEVGAVRAGGRQAVQKNLMGGPVAELVSLQQHAEHLHEQRLAGAEEAADPDADTLLVLADGGICVGVEHAVQVALPLGGDDQIGQLALYHGRPAVGDLDDRLNPLLHGGCEDVPNAHEPSCPARSLHMETAG